MFSLHVSVLMRISDLVSEIPPSSDLKTYIETGVSQI